MPLTRGLATTTTVIVDGAIGVLFDNTSKFENQQHYDYNG